MLIIGLTGGIGSGKSAVAERFIYHNTNVVDADIAARKVVEKGAPALDAIAERFGSKALNAQGELDRAYLRSIVFDDLKEKQWLEKYPLIRDWITNQLQLSTSPYAILESPLLLETNQHTLVARVLLVDVPTEIQLERASTRDNNSSQQIQAIIDNQMPRQKKRELADDIIDNSFSLEKTYDQVDKLHQQYLQLAAKVTTL